MFRRGTFNATNIDAYPLTVTSPAPTASPRPGVGIPVVVCPVAVLELSPIELTLDDAGMSFVREFQAIMACNPGLPLLGAYVDHRAMGLVAGSVVAPDLLTVREPIVMALNAENTSDSTPKAGAQLFLGELGIGHM